MFGSFRKSSFKGMIKDAVSDRHTHETKMLQFTTEVQRVMGLDLEDIQNASREDFVFSTLKYLVEARNTCMTNGWHYVLMVVPKSTGGNVGWSNISSNAFPDGWYYKPQGTRTIAYPTDPKVFEDIMRELKESSYAQRS